MPELSNIQTYERINGNDFQSILEKFKTVLQRIDLWNDEVKQAFDVFEWKVKYDSFGYSSIIQLGYYKTKFSDIPVRPLAMIYTPTIEKAINDNWIVCELLIEAEKLRSFTTGNYCKKTCNFVKSLTSEIYKEFKQTGVYFTDEAQDGQDFDGIYNINKEKLWQFDYAIIPMTLEDTYFNPPLTHKIIHIENHLEAWNINKWPLANLDL